MRLRDLEWLFVPAPDGAVLVGTCTGPYPAVRGLSAALKPMPEE